MALWQKSRTDVQDSVFLIVWCHSQFNGDSAQSIASFPGECQSPRSSGIAFSVVLWGAGSKSLWKALHADCWFLSQWCHMTYLEAELFPRSKDIDITLRIFFFFFLMFRSPSFYFTDCKRKTNRNPFDLCSLTVKVILENQQWYNSKNVSSGYEPEKSIFCCYDAWKLFTNKSRFTLREVLTYLFPFQLLSRVSCHMSGKTANFTLLYTAICIIGGNCWGNS